MGHVARPGARGALRSGALPLSLPLVQRLLRRPDDEPAGARDRHRPVGDRRGARAGRRVRPAQVADGLRRDAGRLRSDLRVPGLPGELVEPRGVRGRARQRARVLWDEGHADDQPQGVRDRARPRADAGVADSELHRAGPLGRQRAVPDRGGEGRRLRPGARPVPPARPQLPRLGEEPPGTGFRSRRRTPDRRRLSPGEYRRASGARRRTGTRRNRRSSAIRKPRLS